MALFIVSNTNDSGAGSLRQAIIDADAAAGADEIQFAAGLDGQTITLTSVSPLQITSGDGLTINGDIDGDGDADVAISNNNAEPILLVSTGAVASLQSMEIRDGYGHGSGAVILNNGTLDIGYSTITGNVYQGQNNLYTNNAGGRAGGAIVNAGALTVTETFFADNIGLGGYGSNGIYQTFSSGAAGYGGGDAAGAILNAAGASLTLDGVGFNNNIAEGGAGGSGANGEPNYSGPYNGGDGGDGGDAAGAILNLGTISGTYGGSGNTAMAGSGGSGGGAGANGANGNNGSSGAAVTMLLNNGSGALTTVQTGTSGVDTQTIAAGATFFALGGADVISGGAGSTLHGGGGNDMLTLTGAGTLNGGLGNDTLNGASGVDILNGGAGDDIITGGDGVDTVNGGDGDDQITGGFQVDILNGDAGDDTFFITGIDFEDDIDGGADDDTLNLTGHTRAFTINLDTDVYEATLGGTGGPRDLISVENVIGGENDDDITGDSTAKSLNGGGGGDTIRPDAGGIFTGQVYDGGTGTDTLDLAATPSSRDYVVNLTTGLFTENGGFNSQANNFENVIGGAGDDTIVGNGEINNLQGGGNNAEGDTISYVGSSAGVTIDLETQTVSGGDAAGDTISGFENATGSDEADLFFAASGGDGVYDGGGGNDSFDTFGNNGTFLGGADDDLFDAAIFDVTNTAIFDGGSGTDAFRTTQASTGTFDLRDDTLTSIERLIVAPGGANTHTLEVNAAQLTSSGVTSLEVGSFAHVGGAGVFSILMNGETTLDLSTFATSGFVEPGDGIMVTGDGDAETITASAVRDTINADAGDDTIIIGAAGIVAGEFFDGGTGTGDTLDFSASSASYNLNLDADTFDLIGGGAASTVLNIENVIGGSGNDIIKGSGVVEDIKGGDGDDTLSLSTVGISNGSTYDGEGGTNTFSLSAAFDYEINLAAQTLVEGAGSRVATAKNFTHVIGGPQADVIIGNGLDNELSGSSGVDQILGGSGNDTIDGGAGADQLLGGAGDDTFIVDDLGDAAGENASQGIDTVESSVSFILGANIEHLTLTGSDAIDGQGNGEMNTIIGNDQANGIAGGNGNDILIGGGGNDSLDGQNGNDIMRGGTGSDGYNVERVGDVVEEDFNGGEFDLVRTTITLTLPDNVEIGILRGGAALPIDITGNSGSGNDIRNLILGNDSVNTITTFGGRDVILGRDGADTIEGGLGVDRHFGGQGDDTYIVESVFDIVGELVNQGNDSVFSSDSYFLSADVENLTLTGTASNDGVGNSRPNIITGNAGANGLSGGNSNDLLIGGAGNDSLDGQNGIDIMRGGTGSDGYNVDRIEDVVEEDFNGGEFDILRTAVTYTLPDNVEILILKGGSGTVIDGTGNDGAGNVRNLVLGNNAANRLETFGGRDVILGRDGDDRILAGGDNDNISGGNGADILTGGSGADFFNFTNIAEGGDLITDFSVSDADVLDLRAMFDTFAGGSALNTTTAQAGGFLTLTDNGSSISVFADSDGGADNSQLIALLQNVTEDVTVVDNFILV